MMLAVRKENVCMAKVMKEHVTFLTKFKSICVCFHFSSSSISKQIYENEQDITNFSIPKLFLYIPYLKILP